MTVHKSDAFKDKILKWALKESDGKFSLKESAPRNLFLPPLSEVIKGLGYKSNLSAIIKIIELQSNQPLDLSEPTRYNLENKGVGRNSLISLIDWVYRISSIDKISLIIRKSTSLKMIRLSLLGTTSADWIAILEGLKIGGNGEGFETIVPPLDQFIRNRCKEQDNNIRKARRDIKNKTFNVHDNQEAWARMAELWSSHTLVSAAQLESINGILKQAATSTEEKEHLNNQVKLAFTCLEYDFYLEAIALMEIEISLQLPEASRNCANNPYISIIGKSISDYASSNPCENTSSIKSCLGGLLFNLTVLLPNEGNNGSKYTGWKKLSRNIDLTDQGSSETLAQRQYDTIKGWREGTAKNRPSVKTFNNFIENVSVSLNDSRVASLEFAYRITVMLDKLEASILANTDDKDATKKKIKEVLARYPIYYQECLQRYELK
jgi:hypothetical protein